MTKLESIINTTIITSEYDDYWEDVNDKVPGSADVTLLVISKPYIKGGTEDSQLGKMLQACTLNEQQYFVLLTDSKIAWHKLKDALNPKVVLLLGVHPQELGISAMFHLYYPNRFNDALWIVSSSLSEMETQPEVKKQLWIHGLKPVFVDRTISVL